MSSAITMDYTGFETFPASSPENWPILKNGLNSTWRESLSQSLVDKIDSSILEFKEHNVGHNFTSRLKLHKEWKLDEMKDKYYDEDTELYDRDIGSEFNNEAFCIWLVHDIPLYNIDENIDTKIIDHFNNVYGESSQRSENNWVAEAKKLLAQPNQTIYNIYNTLWNHPDTQKKLNFRMDMDAHGW